MDNKTMAAVRRRVCGRCARTVHKLLQRDADGAASRWIASQPGSGCLFCLPPRKVEDVLAERSAARALNQYAAPDAE